MIRQDMSKIVALILAGIARGDTTILTDGEYSYLLQHTQPDSAFVLAGKVYPMHSLKFHLIPDTPTEWNDRT